MIEKIVFFFLAGLTLGSAILVITLRNIFHSALWLVACLSGVAALYAMLGADFLFAVQILLYAGGVMVVLLFVVLLSGRPSDWTGLPYNHQWLSALLAGSIVVAGIFWAALKLKPPQNPEMTNLPTTSPLGHLLLGPMVLPFEVISLVILVALMGSIFFSQKRHDRA